MISIVLPAYNEEFYVRENTIRIINEMKKLGGKYEIIIIEESADKTPLIVKELCRKYKTIRHFHFEKRLGKGRALEFGIRKSRGSKVVFMDIDLAVDLSALKPLLDMLDKYDVVVGSRYNPASKTKRTIIRLLLGRAYAMLPRVLLRINIRDFQCGFKGFKSKAGKDIINHTRSRGVFWDTEFLYYAKRNGYTIGEVPVVWAESRSRNIKIGLKTIILMGTNLSKIFLRSLFRM